MEIEQMRAAWQELSEQNQRNSDLLVEIRKELSFQKARKRLSWFLWRPIFELAMGLLAPWLLGLFLVNGPHEAKFVIPALLLYLLAIAEVASKGWQIATIACIDQAEPILVAQKKLLSVHKVRVQTTKWTFLISPLLWPALAIVAFKGVLRADVYRDFGITYVFANVAFGVAFIPLMLWVSRSLGGRLQGLPFWQSLVDDLGGRSLSITARELGEISKFESA